MVPGIVSEWVIVVKCQLSNFSAISWREQVNFQWEDDEDDDDEICFVLDQRVYIKLLMEKHYFICHSEYLSV